MHSYKTILYINKLKLKLSSRVPLEPYTLNYFIELLDKNLNLENLYDNRSQDIEEVNRIIQLETSIVKASIIVNDWETKLKE